MAEVGSLWVRLKADFSDFEKNMDKLTKNVKKTSEKFDKTGKTMSKWVTGPIMAAGTGMTALAIKIGNTADRLLDLSSITGMSTDAIQEWQHVTRIAGVSTETVTTAVEGLVRRLPQLEAEGGRSTEQLQKLGLSFDDLRAMAPDQMIDTLITSLASLEDPLERNAIGSSLFGGAWKDLAPILDMGADGIEAARREAHELGLVMSKDSLEGANDFRIEMERLKAQFAAVMNEIAVNLVPLLRDVFLPLVQEHLIPAIQRFAERITELIEWFRNLDPQWQKVILTAVGFLAALGPVLVVVGKVISLVGTLMGVLAKLGPAITFLTGPIGLVIAAVAAAIAIGIALWRNWDKVVGFLSGLWELFANWFHDVIGSRIAGAFNWLIQCGQAFQRGFIQVFNAVKNAIRGPVNAILGFVNAIIAGWEGMLNAVGNAVNSIPRFDIPNWVPGIGGKTFGLPRIPSINLPRVPLLAEGGLVTSPTLAVIGEAGPEAVIPLGRSGITKDMAQAVYNAVVDAHKALPAQTGDNDQPLEIKLYIDRTVLGKVATRSLRELQRQGGSVLIPV